jgi:Mrp family chromosome partitioning ATPase
LLDRLAEEHDIVIIDTPPVVAVSDAVPLLAAADAVLVVSRVGMTTTRDARELRRVVDHVPGVSVIGIVANDVGKGEGKTGYYYGE